MSRENDVDSWFGFRADNMELADLIDRSEWGAAIPLLEALAQTGDVQATSILGACYYLGLGVEQDPPEGVRLLREAAERGSAIAAHNLGTAYLCGAAGVKSDVDEARRYYALAASLGSPFPMSIDTTGLRDESDDVTSA